MRITCFLFLIIFQNSFANDLGDRIENLDLKLFKFNTLKLTSKGAKEINVISFDQYDSTLFLYYDSLLYNFNYFGDILNKVNIYESKVNNIKNKFIFDKNVVTSICILNKDTIFVNKFNTIYGFSISKNQFISFVENHGGIIKIFNDKIYANFSDTNSEGERYFNLYSFDKNLNSLHSDGCLISSIDGDFVINKDTLYSGSYQTLVIKQLSNKIKSSSITNKLFENVVSLFDFKNDFSDYDYDENGTLNFKYLGSYKNNHILIGQNSDVNIQNHLSIYYYNYNFKVIIKKINLNLYPKIKLLNNILENPLSLFFNFNFKYSNEENKIFIFINLGESLYCGIINLDKM